jgi:hypothetical protein
MSSEQPQALQWALDQRNQAVACAILALVIALALVMNTFLGHRRELKAAQDQVVTLQTVLRDTQAALRANQQELVQTQEALRREQEALTRATRAH